MPDPYQLDLTAAQINQAVNNAFDSDREPSPNQSTLCNGNKISAYVERRLGDEATAREAADTALGVRIDAIPDTLGVRNTGEFTTTSETPVTITSGTVTITHGSNITYSNGVFTLAVGGFYRVDGSVQLKSGFVNIDSATFSVFGKSVSTNDNTYTDRVVNTVGFIAAGSYPVTLQVSNNANNSGTAYAKSIYLSISLIA